MVIKRVYFINAIMSLDSVNSISSGSLVKGQPVTIKYSEKLNAIVVNSTIIPMSQVKEIVIEEEKEEVKPTKAK